MKITGTISDAKNEKPLSNAIVTITAADTNLVENYPANDKGEFSYVIPDTAIPAESYTLVILIQRKGYLSKTTEHIITHADIDFQLDLERIKLDWSWIIRTSLIALAIELLLFLMAGLYIYFTYYKPHPIPPTITIFTSDATLIRKNSQIKLKWDTNDAESVTLNDKSANTAGEMKLQVAQTTLYTLTATGQNADIATKTITVTVLPDPGIVKFTATPPQIQMHDLSKLEWQVTDADTLCIMAGPENEQITADMVRQLQTGQLAPAGSLPQEAEVTLERTPQLAGAADVSPMFTQLYTLVAVNKLGAVASASLEVKVLTPPQILYFNAQISRESNILEVIKGQPLTLKVKKGDPVTVAVEQTQAPDTQPPLKVAVKDGDAVLLEVQKGNPETLKVKKGQAVTLTWQTQDADLAFLNEERTGLDYSTQVAPEQTTTYTLKVKNVVGERQANITVLVPQPIVPPEPKPVPPAVINYFRCDPLQLVKGQQVFLSWQTENAAKVYLDDQEVDISGSQSLAPTLAGPYRFMLKAVDYAGIAVTWNRTVEVFERPTVILYELENYCGQSEQCSADTPVLTRVQNAVSSIKIIGNCTVTVYSAPHYRGTQMELNRSTTSLRGSWIGSNAIASLKIVPAPTLLTPPEQTPETQTSNKLE